MPKPRPTGANASITGGGASWEYVRTDNEIAQEAVDYISTRALLDAPIAIEDAALCVRSADEIQKQMLALAKETKRGGKLHSTLLHVAHSCKYFKANAGPNGRNFCSAGGWTDIPKLRPHLEAIRSDLNSALSEFVQSFKARRY